MKFKKQIFLSLMLIVSVLGLSGCNEIVTTKSTTSGIDSTTAVTTTQEITTQEITTEEITTQEITTQEITTQEITTATTVEVTTTEDTSATSTTIPTTTEYTTTVSAIVEVPEDLDELNISISRLENAIFEVDFNEAFSQTNEVDKLLIAVRIYNRSFIGNKSLLGSIELDVDVNDYVQHPYWQYQYFHVGMFTIPTLSEGMYEFDETLESYINLHIDNLSTCAKGVTERAKIEADWAIDNIKIMNTWIQKDSRRYLLNYDSKIDVVNLFKITEMPHLYGVQYLKTSIYYNDCGEEVIEVWENNYYYDGIYKDTHVAIYYNSVAARDFNFYDVGYDKDNQRTGGLFRGINLNADGKYQYYENHSCVISGTGGWYSVIPHVDNVNETISAYPTNTHPLNAYTPDGNSNVVSIIYRDDKYNISLYLPSMNGVTAILIEEDSLIGKNVDSPETQQFLIDEGYLPLDNYYGFDDQSSNNYTTGIKTANGSYLSTDALWNDSINLKKVTLDIYHARSDDGNAYNNYYGVVDFEITANTLNDALNNLSQYLADAGISYKYGDISILFDEVCNVYNSNTELFKTLSITNPFMKLPYAALSSYSNYQSTIDFIYNYVNVKTEFDTLLEEYSTIQFSEMPEDIDLDDVTFVDMNNITTGEVIIDENGIDTSGISVDFPKSVLLFQGNEYSVFYAFTIKNKLFIIDNETSQIYDNEELNFTGNLVNEGLPDVPVGDYMLTMFFGKLTTDGFIRISNVIPVKATEFEDITLSYNSGDAGGTFAYDYVYYEGNILIQFTYTDTKGPDVILEGYETIFNDEVELTIPYQFNVDDTIQSLFDLILSVTDNYDIGDLDFDYTNITLDDAVVSSLDELLVSGYYVFTVSDETGNETILTIPVNVTCTVAFYDENNQFIEEQLIEVDSAAIEPIIDTITGYTISWDTDFTTVTNNLSVTLVLILNQYTITYMVDDEVYYVEENVDFGSNIVLIAEPTKVGYTFGDWIYTLESLTMPDADLVITGYFTANE